MPWLKGRRPVDNATLKSRRRVLLGQLQRALDAEEFVRTTLNARNVNVENNEIVMSCPLPWGLHKHGDQKPSAALNQERLLFNCFTCGGGDVFWLVQSIFDVDFQGAVDLLSDYFKPRTLTKQELIAELEDLWTRPEEASFQIPIYSTRMLDRWKRYSPYLIERGIPKETQRDMSTGVDLKHKEKGEDDLWVVQPRVVIPHFFKGKLVGWVKRKTHDGSEGPKYRNSPGFPRNETLYGIDKVDSTQPVVVVESTLSVLALRSRGFTNAVATFGAKVGPLQMELMRQFPELILFFDSDDEGWKATKKVGNEVRAYTKAQVVPNEKLNTDPCDYTADELKELIDNRVPVVLVV